MSIASLLKQAKKKGWKATKPAPEPEPSETVLAKQEPQPRERSRSPPRMMRVTRVREPRPEPGGSETNPSSSFTGSGSSSVKTPDPSLPLPVQIAQLLRTGQMTVGSLHKYSNTGVSTCLKYLGGQCTSETTCGKRHPSDPEEIAHWLTVFKRQPCKFGAMCNGGPGGISSANPFKWDCVYLHPGEQTYGNLPTSLPVTTPKGVVSGLSGFGAIGGLGGPLKLGGNDSPPPDPVDGGDEGIDEAMRQMKELEKRKPKPDPAPKGVEAPGPVTKALTNSDVSSIKQPVKRPSSKPAVPSIAQPFSSRPRTTTAEDAKLAEESAPRPETTAKAAAFVDAFVKAARVAKAKPESKPEGSRSVDIDAFVKAARAMQTGGVRAAEPGPAEAATPGSPREHMDKKDSPAEEDASAAREPTGTQDTIKAVRESTRAQDAIKDVEGKDSGDEDSASTSAKQRLIDEHNKEIERLRMSVGLAPLGLH